MLNKQGGSKAGNEARVRVDTNAGDRLVFDEENHIYRKDGRIIPSVTDIVGDECGRPGYATDWHLNRGSMIHKAMSLYVTECLHGGKVLSVDPRIKDRVESGKKAIKELGLDHPPFIIEQHMDQRLYGFGGTPDLYAGGVLIDWKSSHMPECEIQGGGYILLIEQAGHPAFPVKRFLEIVLGDNGYYKPFEYKPSRSKRLFLAALTMYQWRHNG